MGCNISELPKDTDQAIKQKIQALDSIQDAFQAMEMTINETILKRSEQAANQIKLMK